MAIQRRLVLSGIGFLVFGSLAALAQEDARSREYSDQLAAIPTAEELYDWHDLLGSEPHVAGTRGDVRQIERLTSAFKRMGLETEVHWFKALLPQPVSAELEIVGTEVDEQSSGVSRRGIIPLPIVERNLLEDPASQHPGLTYGWNAFSGSGDVTAEVVYANYGTYEDFERLREMGIDVDRKIVIARYGKNYRGFKVKYAQEAGAAGLLMYLDPADYGYDKGETWPKGGWANPTCIQRGSVLVLPYKGDSLTPFVEAKEQAERLEISDVTFPWIPVQPIGYAAASRILSRMEGPEVSDSAWQGGLPFPYRIEGGEALQVRLQVEQDKRLRKSANVLGMVRGAVLPDEFIVIGCHHDAWGFGAADPLAGSIVLMEVARAVSELAKRGERPDRTIVFAAWGAEEYGIIGSTEWVEGNAQQLRDNCVAYINLDMAAMGNNFYASATPVLRNAVTQSLLPVPQAGANDNQTLAETWADRDGGPSYGDLGGGSDHVGFVCHVGVPSLRLGAGGAPGVAYHSNYDTLDWYRSIVGEDYASALMVTRACAHVIGMFADSPLPAYEWTTVASELKRHAQNSLEQARAAGMEVDLAGLDQAADRLAEAAAQVEQAIAVQGKLSPDQRRRIGAAMLEAERAWLDEKGLPKRPWYRNTYISDDPRSGYAASPLPALQIAERAGDAEAYRTAVAHLAGRVDLLADRLGEVRSLLENKP